MVPYEESECCEEDVSIREFLCCERDSFWQKIVCDKEKEIACLLSKIAVMNTRRSFHLNVKCETEKINLENQLRLLEIKFAILKGEKEAAWTDLEQLKQRVATKIQEVQTLESKIVVQTDELTTVSQQVETARTNRMDHSFKKETNFRSEQELADLYKQIADQSAQIAVMETEAEGAKAEIHRLRGIVSILEVHKTQHTTMYAELEKELTMTSEVVLTGETPDGEIVDQEDFNGDTSKQYELKIVDMEAKTAEAKSLLRQVEAEIKAEKAEFEKTQADANYKLSALRLQMEKEREEYRKKSNQLDQERDEWSLRVYTDYDSDLRVRVVTKENELEVLRAKVQAMEKKVEHSQKLICGFCATTTQ